jgi:predicted DCC family thiol-disulfide oxidoreductase YuxK
MARATVMCPNAPLPWGIMKDVAESMRPVILFDGVCHLCNGFVQFVLRRDRAGQFDFAPLQSEFGRERLGTLHLDGIVLVERGQVVHAEKAVLRVLSGLQRPWPGFARIAGALPGPLLAWVYRLVARRRYGLFGKDEVCALPKPEWKGRFLS